MKGKNILVTAACVIGFGGIVANTLVGVATARELRDQINANKAEAEKGDADAKAYAASQKQEAINEVNRTRDSLKAAYEAADASLRKGLDDAIAQIEEAKAQLEDETDAKDAALRAEIIAQLNNLVTEISDALGDLGGDIDAVRTIADQVNQKVTVLETKVASLETAVEGLQDAVLEIAQSIQQIGEAIQTIATVLGQTANALVQLQQQLEANYYTAAEVNNYLTTLQGSLSTIENYFKVNGNLTTLQDLVDGLPALAGMEAFNGTEATAAKAQYVAELFAIIAAYDHDVTDTYNRIVTAYGVQSLAVPAAVTTLKDNLLASSGLAELKDKMMVAMTRIILAPTKEAAKAVRDEYAGGVEYEIDALRFEEDRIKASNAVFALKTTTGTYQFGNDEFAYFSDNGIMDYAFNNSTAQDKAAYYTKAKADLAFRVAQAKGLSALQTKLNARYAEIEALNDGVRLTNATVIDPYLDIVDVLAKIDTYKTAITKVENEVLVLDTEEKINNYVNSIDEDAALVAYAADKYELLLQAQKTNKATVNGYTAELATLNAGYEGTIVDAIAAAVKDTFYQAALDAARGADADKTLADRKTMIDNYITDKVADCVYQARVAKYLVDVKAAANVADAEIDALANLSAGEKATLKGAYANANVPTLDALYEASYKGVKEGENTQFATEAQFTALLNKATADITAVRTIAAKENAMNKDADEKATALSTAYGAETDTTIVGIGEDLELFVYEAQDNYTLVSDTAIAFVTPTEEQAAAGQTKATLTAALATENATAQVAATKLAVDTYAEYLGLVNSANDLNSEIEHRMLTFVAAFKAAHHNKAGDQNDVADAHATDIANLKTKYKKVLVDAVNANNPNALPIYAFGGAAYGTDYDALVAFQAALAPYGTQIATDKTAFNAEADALLVTMVGEFNTKEAARLIANKKAYIGEDGQAGEGTKVGALYAKIKAKVGADTAKLALAEAINGSLIDNINRATTSDAVLDVYEAMCESFLADVFGQARDTATYATAEAQLEAYLA